MKRFIIAVSLALAFASCHRCQNLTQVEQAPVIRKYFGNYKPGTYWIYLNRDSTKRDSVWVSDYQKSFTEDPDEQCLKMEAINFKINATYLSWGVSFSGYIGSNAQDFQHTLADISNYGFVARHNDSSLRAEADDSLYPIFHNYNLWPSAAVPIILPEGIKVNKVFLAPDTGIVQFVSPYGPDTFSLVKFYKS